MHLQKITPCLWFDTQAEEAAQFYCAIFPNSTIRQISRYGETGHEIHGMPAGSVLTVAFELDGQAFTALNGGPVFQFTEPFPCRSIAYQKSWTATGIAIGRGDERAQQCGWLKDKYGLSWQIVPATLAK